MKIENEVTIYPLEEVHEVRYGMYLHSLQKTAKEYPHHWLYESHCDRDSQVQTDHDVDTVMLLRHSLMMMVWIVIDLTREKRVKR